MSSRNRIGHHKDDVLPRLFRTRRTAVSSLATLVLIFGSCAHPLIREQSPQEQTAIRIRGWGWAIHGYRTAEGQLPDSLEMACELETTPCEIFVGNDPVLDAWGQRISYVLMDGDFELISRGEDGRPGTADDIIFSSVEERDRVSRIAGCYSVALDWWDPSLGNHLRLDTIQAVGGWYRLLPEIPHHLCVWAPVARDSVEAFWVEVDTGLTMYLRVRADSLVGRAINGGGWKVIEAVRVPCPQGT